MKPTTRRNLIIAAAIAVVVVCVLDVLLYLNGHRKKDSSPSPSPSASATVQPGAVQPFTTLLPHPANIDTNKVTTSIVKGTVITSKGQKLSVQKVSFTSHSDQCSVQKATDVCFAAQGNTSDGANLSVYYVKDAVHSRLFDYASHFEQVQVANTSAAATMALDSDKNENALAVINKDSSGWLILTNNSDLSEMTNLSQNVVVS